MIDLEPMGALFNSRGVSSKLKIPVKEASRDLMRLRKMGFLKRQKVQRTCRNGRGECRKGYQFLYAFSKQGKSYLKWLKNHGYGDPLLHSIPWQQIPAYPSMAKLYYALWEPVFTPSKFKPARPIHLRDSLNRFYAMENLEFLTENRKLRKENRNLYLLLAKLEMDREEEKKNLLQKQEKRIIIMLIEKMGLELKLRSEHLKDTFVRDRRESKTLEYFGELFITTIGAGIPVNGSIVIPREALVKAGRIGSTFLTKIGDMFPSPPSKVIST